MKHNMFQMVVDYDTDINVTNVVDNFDFYFLPVMNPDGYAFTWEGTGSNVSLAPNYVKSLNFVLTESSMKNDEQVVIRQ